MPGGGSKRGTGIRSCEKIVQNLLTAETLRRRGQKIKDLFSAPQRLRGDNAIFSQLLLPVTFMARMAMPRLWLRVSGFCFVLGIKRMRLNRIAFCKIQGQGSKHPLSIEAIPASQFL
jgi:hypothetical protein